MTRTMRAICRAGLVAGLAVAAGAGLARLAPRPARAPAIAARPDGPPPAPPAPERRGPAVWAIVVGIDQYRDDAIPACHGAVADARAVAAWLAGAAGWGERNVLLMIDRAAPEADPGADLVPTRANLDRAVKKWLTPRVAPGDVVVFYFAGQAAAPGRAFLLPIDAQASRPEQTGWAPDEALDALAASGRGPVICWLDTSPRGRGRAVGAAAEGRPAGAGPRLLQSLTRWPGTTAWLAADARPAAEASAVGRRGPFAAALLAGLGTPERPRSLLGCLDAMNRDPALAAQGFHALGGIDAGLSLWSGQARRRAAAARQLLLQRGHALGVSAIAFTPDGHRMVTGGGDSTLRIWRVSDRALLRSLSYHLVGVTGLALSPDGRFLASGDGSGRLRLWDLRDHAEVVLGPPLDSGVEAVAFLPDGARFASFERGGAIRLHEPAPARPAQLLASDGRALAVASGPGPVAVALVDAGGKVLLFDAAGRPLRALPGPEGTVTSRGLATDGRRVAVGNTDGRTVVWDAEAGRVVDRFECGPQPGPIVFGPEGALAVGDGLTIRWIAGPGAAVKLPLPGPAGQVAVAIDGRWLAATTTGGDLRVWRLDDPAGPVAVALAGLDKAEPITCVAFAPDGRALAAGEQGGGLRSWDLPGGEARPRVPPRRGQVARLGVSADGRYLLQVTKDRAAQVWDLQDGRAVATIAGEWISGAIAPDGASLALIDRKSGEVILVDRASGRPRPPSLRRPPGAEGEWGFGVVAFSPDGRLLAAGSDQAPQGGPLACVWDARGGELRHTLKGHEDPHRLTAVDFSADSRRLLTAGEDGSARVWDLSGPTPAAVRVLRATDPKSGRPVAIRSARFSPADSGRVAAGTLDGRVLIWDAGQGRPAHTLDVLAGETRAADVRAVAFTPDGRWLAAAGGADRSVRLWELGAAPRPVRLEPAPNHAEVVNDLLAWPGGALIASGGDDATVKLWKLGDRRLLGTLSAEQDTPDWVIYTPEGLFDSSPGGERQVSWLVRDELVSLEQEYDRAHVFGLGDALRKGRRPDPPTPPSAPAPRLSIDPPARAVVGADRRLELTIRLDDPTPTDLRLYQDGVPIRTGEDLRPAPGQRSVTVAVRLRSAPNRFYAMGSRPGSIDGRSNAIEIPLDGPPDPAGRVHVLALGVSRYDREGRSLRFADRDAEDLARHLHEHGLHAEGEVGARIVLTNRDVTEAAVDAAFLEIRDRVEGHPDDSVTIFLAGHTDVLARRFHLLLPPFPFPAGPQRPAAGPLDLKAGTVLPFAAIYRNLSRLGALHRLVVVDACQAEAIHDDPAIRRIREAIDDGAHRARTAYLLAARRGEPAGEVAAIEHGMLTYVLLKGMGRDDLTPVPGLPIFDDVPNADRDRDGRVSTDELRRYADLTLPRLADNFPALVQLQRSGQAGPPVEVRPTANLDQAPRVQSAGASFPLVVLPRRPNPPADAGVGAR